MIGIVDFRMPIADLWVSDRLCQKRLTPTEVHKSEIKNRQSEIELGVNY